MITLIYALIIYGSPNGFGQMKYSPGSYPGGCHALLVDWREVQRNRDLSLWSFECHEWIKPIGVEGNG